MNSSAKNHVVAIGNFDGVHKGHAALLARARAIADGPLTVLTFEPHPRQFFAPDSKPFRITPAALKERRLKDLGVDHVQVMAFDADLAGKDAQNFIDDIIVKKLNASHVVVGADFHFGKNRGGHVDTLQADGRFKVEAVTLENEDAAPISSTRIREAIAEGDIATANALLGWPWEIEGEVIHGDKRGRDLGYPTANIALGETLAPGFGIYAVRACVKGVWKNGVANIGIRPMFESKMPLLEVFIFDFSGDLYGEILRVQPVQKLRDEARFEGLDALKAQMDRDSAAAKAIFGA